jgi:glycosyltransferase involved in cell wall biosynthesis
MPATGAPLPESPLRSRPAGAPLRALYAGRLTYWKGVHLALQALALRPADATLTVIGTGSDRKRLERRANRLGISDRVRFTGSMSRAAVLELLAEHDVFLFPSLQDSGGMAVLEAMSEGLPVVCLDVGGPALAVTPNCGVVVAATSPAEAVRDLAAALTMLAVDEEQRQRMGAAAQRRVADAYDWSTRGTLLRELYAYCREQTSALQTGLALRSDTWPG